MEKRGDSGHWPGMGNAGRTALPQYTRACFTVNKIARILLRQTPLKH
jgi:hypothetical protein